MTKISITVLSVVIGTLTTPAMAENCAEIVNATIEEMSAAAGANWNETTEAVARQAAGSACVKANSGRYADDQKSLTEQPVTAQGIETTAAAATAQQSEELVFKPLTSSPTEKPYERARSQKDE